MQPNKPSSVRTNIQSHKNRVTWKGWRIPWIIRGKKWQLLHKNNRLAWGNGIYDRNTESFGQSETSTKNKLMKKIKWERMKEAGLSRAINQIKYCWGVQGCERVARMAEGALTELAVIIMIPWVNTQAREWFSHKLKMPAPDHAITDTNLTWQTHERFIWGVPHRFRMTNNAQHVNDVSPIR